MKQKIKQVRQSSTFIDNDTYEQFKLNYPIACVDIFVRNPDTGKILLIGRTGEPAKNELWPVGGRLRIFQKPDEAVRELTVRETGLDVDISTAKLIGVGDTNFRKRDDGNGEDRHTINLTFIADLAKSSRTEVDFSKGEASRVEWISSARELFELRVDRTYSNMQASDIAFNLEKIGIGYFPHPQAVHPYITRMLLESRIFEGKQRWPSEVIVSDERTGLLTPVGLISAEQTEKGRIEHKNDIGLNSDLRAARRDALDTAFMLSMPVIHIETVNVYPKMGVLFKKTKDRPELPYAPLPIGITAEAVAKGMALNSFGNQYEKQDGIIGSLGTPKSTTLIAVQDRRMIREDGSKGQDIVLTFLELWETMRTDGMSDVIWAKRPEDLEAFGVDPVLSKAIENSGAFVNEAETDKAVSGRILKSAKRN
jgi:ADP-ribose pyrophosphatase YjhB (NUDIX family)